MNQIMGLTLGQEFSLRSFTNQVQQMFWEQAQEFLLLHPEYMIRKRWIKKILKQDGKLDRDFGSL